MFWSIKYHGFLVGLIVKEFYYYHTSENRRNAFTVPPVNVLYEHFCNIDNKESLKLKVWIWSLYTDAFIVANINKNG